MDDVFDALGNANVRLFSVIGSVLGLRPPGFEFLILCLEIKDKKKIKPTKCDFAADNVTDLGHVITKDGIKVDQKQVAAVRDFPVPKNESQLRSCISFRTMSILLTSDASGHAIGFSVKRITKVLNIPLPMVGDH